VQTQRPGAAADDIAMPRLFGVLTEESQQMPGIGERRVFCPLHLDGRELAVARDDEIHFRAIVRTLVMERASAQVLQPLPEFDAHPLLKDRTGIGQHDIRAGTQPGGGMADAEVEEEKSVGGEQIFARGYRKNAGRRKPRNMSSKSW